MKLEILEKTQMPLWRFQTLSREIMKGQALLTKKLAISPQNTLVLRALYPLKPLKIETLESADALLEDFDRRAPET